ALQLAHQGVDVELLDQQDERRRPLLDGLAEPVDPLVADPVVDDLGGDGAGPGAHARPDDPPHRPAEDEAEEAGPEGARQGAAAGLEVDRLAHHRAALVVLADEHGVEEPEVALRRQPRGGRQELLGPEGVPERDADQRAGHPALVGGGHGRDPRTGPAWPPGAGIPHDLRTLRLRDNRWPIRYIRRRPQRRGPRPAGPSAAGARNVRVELGSLGCEGSAVPRCGEVSSPRSSPPARSPRTPPGRRASRRPRSSWRTCAPGPRRWRRRSTCWRPRAPRSRRPWPPSRSRSPASRSSSTRPTTRGPRPRPSSRPRRPASRSWRGRSPSSRWWPTSWSSRPSPTRRSTAPSRRSTPRR